MYSTLYCTLVFARGLPRVRRVSAPVRFYEYNRSVRLLLWRPRFWFPHPEESIGHGDRTPGTPNEVAEEEWEPLEPEWRVVALMTFPEAYVTLGLSTRAFHEEEVRNL